MLFGSLPLLCLIARPNFVPCNQGIEPLSVAVAVCEDATVSASQLEHVLESCLRVAPSFEEDHLPVYSDLDSGLAILGDAKVVAPETVVFVAPFGIYFEKLLRLCLPLSVFFHPTDFAELGLIFFFVKSIASPSEFLDLPTPGRLVLLSSFLHALV